MEFNALLNSLPSCWAMVKVNKIWKEAMLYIDILMEYFELWIVFFFTQVISLPSQQCPYKTRITESSFVVRADVVTLRGG